MNVSAPRFSHLDFLRVFAILVVFFFHLEFQFFELGYLGVDIFFILSGFLISHVSRDLKSFREFVRFLGRRFLRVAGPASIVLFFCIPFFLVSLPSRELKDFAQFLFSFVLNGSNYLFYMENDYFDVTSEFKPFLHYWSLSVEIQFYFIFACIGWVFATRSFFVIVFCSVLSFLFFFKSVDYSLAFYSLFGRFWLFGLGGVLYFLRFRSLNGLSWFFVLIGFFFCTFFWLNYSSYYLVMLLFVSFFIFFVPSNLSIFDFKPLRYFADRSFLIYLLHWPPLVFFRFSIGEIDFTLKAFFFLSVVFLSALIFPLDRFFAVPFREGVVSRMKSVVLVYSLIAVFALVLLLRPSFLFSSQLFSFELEHEDKFYRACMVGEGGSLRSEICSNGSTSTNQIFLLGDSHANSVFSASSLVSDFEIFDLSHSGCPFVLGVNRVDLGVEHGCAVYNDEVLKFLVDLPALQTNDSNPTVLLISRLDQYFWGSRFSSHEYGVEPGPSSWVDRVGYSRSFSDLERRLDFLEDIDATVRILQSLGFNVVVFAPFPSSGYPASFISSRIERANFLFGSPKKRVATSVNQYVDRFAVFAELFQRLDGLDNVKVFDPLNVLCDRELCYFTSDAFDLWFSDSHHLSFMGSDMLWRELEPMLRLWIH